MRRTECSRCGSSATTRLGTTTARWANGPTATTPRWRCRGRGGAQRVLTMPLPDHWATIEDFATLFQYFWHRDFPIGQGATGAKRADWTIHTGVVVRQMADLMGLVTRFESGGRKDAILRGDDGDEIAIEWEYESTWSNELEKLRNHKIWRPGGRADKPLRFAVLITYAPVSQIEQVHLKVGTKWRGASWPLLLVLVDYADSERSRTRREFQCIHASAFDREGRRDGLRTAPALPWRVEGSRWAVEMLWQDPESIEDLDERRQVPPS